MTRARLLFFSFALAVLSLAFVEGFLHVVYFVKRGAPIWQTSRAEFSVRDFTELTDDERVFTARPNIELGLNSFDENRFRRGDNEYLTFPEQVVFLGDSVPFGMGSRAEDSVPSAMFRALQSSGNSKLGVINAALPSYSLRQSISRYRKEVAGRWATRAVILQVYDPATQFAMFGQNWSLDDNWANQNAKLSRIKDKKEGGVRSVFRFSSLYFLYRTIKPGKGDPKLHFRLRRDDEASAARFSSEVRSELTGFLDELRKTGTILFLLPIVHVNEENLSPGLRLTTGLMNEIFSKFAADHPDVTFIDHRPALASRDRQDIFIDDAGHLTRLGAELEAGAILRALSNQRNLLAP
ncbi:MAG: SGNH/GDSL hydrolase family protein [Alphaproteobacteria bacterium]|nr:SGNH/GDSL hydrolase family protein [Alphaproteobacteria bacterium]